MEDKQDRLPLYSSAANLWLLLSLLLSLLVLPLLEGLSAGRPLLLAGLTAVFIIGARAARSTLRIVAVVLLVVALPVAWATLFIGWKPLFIAHCLLGSTFFWLVGGVVFYVVIKTRVATVDALYGAICVFLLFGLAWALSYWAIHTASPTAFSFPNEGTTLAASDSLQNTDFSQFIYFSFVTMTTLGYGDIAPVGRITRTLVWMQSVIGQFYVAVVIAWLVSALPRPGDELR
jgi:voltage-gated potassium channel